MTTIEGRQRRHCKQRVIFAIAASKSEVRKNEQVPFFVPWRGNLISGWPVWPEWSAWRRVFFAPRLEKHLFQMGGWTANSSEFLLTGTVFKHV
jgi:hypothetical protein